MPHCRLLLGISSESVTVRPPLVAQRLIQAAGAIRWGSFRGSLEDMAASGRSAAFTPRRTPASQAACAAQLRGTPSPSPASVSDDVSTESTAVLLHQPAALPPTRDAKSSSAGPHLVPQVSPPPDGWGGSLGDGSGTQGSLHPEQASSMPTLGQDVACSAAARRRQVQGAAGASGAPESGIPVAVPHRRGAEGQSSPHLSVEGDSSSHESSPLSAWWLGGGADAPHGALPGCPPAQPERQAGTSAAPTRGLGADKKVGGRPAPAWFPTTNSQGEVQSSNTSPPPALGETERQDLPQHDSGSKRAALSSAGLEQATAHLRRQAVADTRQLQLMLQGGRAGQAKRGRPGGEQVPEPAPKHRPEAAQGWTGAGGHRRRTAGMAEGAARFLEATDAGGGRPGDADRVQERGTLPVAAHASRCARLLANAENILRGQTPARARHRQPAELSGRELEQAVEAYPCPCCVAFLRSLPPGPLQRLVLQGLQEHFSQNTPPTPPHIHDLWLSL